ncbi:hypothetical protein LXM56_04460 [Lysinibacillus fusiformis]|uniref:SPRY domain-containing protein n=1 Tax=Lysinibacillus fusiformis TaxID=28031 RepID=UPI001E2A08EF|nr:SPRY domain-containing protein [Lysinibacillus fusiformis]MCE4043361.1 hypothetical protein [Lysinibacillus fusiformis]
MDFKWSDTLKSSDATVSNGGKTVNIKGGWAVTQNNMTSGKYYFEFIINVYSQILIGISQSISTATKPTEAQVRAMYGFDGNKIFPRSPYGTAYNASNIIGLAVDMDKGEISFTKDGVNLGVAFDNLKALGEIKLYMSTSTVGGNETLTIVDNPDDMKYRDVAMDFLYNNRITLRNTDTGKSFSVKNKGLIHLPDNSKETILKYGMKQSVAEILDAPFTSHLYPTAVDNKMTSVTIGKSNSLVIKEPTKPWTPLLVWHDIKMTANNAPAPFVASAKGENSTTYGAWKAFNGTTTDANDCWISGNEGATSWVQIKYDKAYQMALVKLTPRVGTDFNTSSPNGFNVLGSNDGIIFDTLLQARSQTWTATTPKQFVLNTTKEYSVYRIETLSTNGSLNVAIGDIIFGYKREVN